MENKKKIIFIDIDGVLNGDNCFYRFIYNFLNFIRLYDLADKIYTNNTKYIDKIKTKKLSKLIKLTRANIVLTGNSRKRIYDNITCKDITPINKKIKRIDKLFKKYDISILDVTPNNKNGKEIEILEWLSKHEYEIESFIIFDPDYRELFPLRDKLIQTSNITALNRQKIKGTKLYKEGIKNTHIIKAIKMLGIEK